MEKFGIIGVEDSVRLGRTCGMAKEKPKRRWYLREWIKERGMTQEKVRELAGVSKGRMSELVSGKERFNDDHLEVFARILGITRSELLEVDPSEGKVTSIHSFIRTWRGLTASDQEKALRAAQAVVESFPKDKKAQ